jgi:3-(3-hydroxy-phenyl)propionate hydroxylase
LYDAIIVGYGPVGATAAILCARHGLRVAVIEQAAGIFDKPRAIGGDHELWRVMQWCGIGEELAAHVHLYNGGRYLGVDGEPIRVFHAPKPPYTLGWPPSFLYIQPEFEAMLRRAAAARANIDVFLEHRLLEFRQRADRVTVAVQDLQRAQRTVFQGRYLIACDGAGSTVRRQLGTALEDLAFDENWAVIDAWLLKPEAVPTQNTQYCRPERPGTYVVGPRNLRRWELKLLPGEDPAQFDVARVREALRPFVDPDAIELWRAAVYRFHALIASRWRAGRVFLAGDAAHQTPPFLGQGLCTGVRDVANLVWKLQRVQRGKAAPSILDSYELERAPHTRTLVAMSKDIGLIVGELDAAAARARDAALRAQMLSGATETLRHRAIPGLSGGLLGHSAEGQLAPLAGEPLVQPRVRTAAAHESLMDDVVGLDFLVVSPDPEPQQWLTRSNDVFWRRIGGLRIVLCTMPPHDFSAAGMTVLMEAEALFAAQLRPAAARAVLVRPDRCIYGAAREPGELNELIDQLRRQLEE